MHWTIVLLVGSAVAIVAAAALPRETIRAAGFNVGAGQPAAGAKAAPGMVVGVALTKALLTFVVPAHVEGVKGARDLVVRFDVGNEELEPTPPALAGKSATVPRSAIAWAVA